MFPIQLILSPCVALLSMCTATGVFMHDTQLDKATTTALKNAAVVAYDTSALPQSGAHHTHSERSPLAQALHDLRSSTPRMQPRDDHRKHVLAKRVVRGVHAFDSYYLPEPV